jgi:hypothetical protein
VVRKKKKREKEAALLRLGSLASLRVCGRALRPAGRFRPSSVRASFFSSI